MHHSISKILFVLGADERRKVKLESAYSFMSKYSKITVCSMFVMLHNLCMHTPFLNLAWKPSIRLEQRLDLELGTLRLRF